MEIRLYRSLKEWSENRHFLCAKIECPDTFDYSSAKSVFKSIYGYDTVVVFICL